MALAPSAILNSFFAVLDSDSAGTTVRAALGNGATSVISADDLAVGALPTAPFVALRGGPIAGIYRRDANKMTATWWLYDDWGSYKYSRIDALIDLVSNAYAENQIAGCDIKRITVGAPVRDASLGNRPSRSITFQIGWR